MRVDINVFEEDGQKGSNVLSYTQKTRKMSIFKRKCCLYNKTVSL